jgi:nitroreductase
MAAELLRQRISTRCFTDDAVPYPLLREILDVARWAPSGGNIQPVRIIAVTGAEKDAVVALAQTGLAQGSPPEYGDRPVYPERLWEPYRSRRRDVAVDMYRLLGIEWDDEEARQAHLRENFRFFGAPVGLFFVIDERMGHGQWAHMGMLMMAVMLAAEEKGLATCPQEAWARFRQSLKAQFHLSATEMVYAGMALGYADRSAPVNRLRSHRIPLDELIEFRGFTR